MATPKRKKKVKRILVTAVKRAYQATGLTPHRLVWFAPSRWNTEMDEETGELTTAAQKANYWRPGKKLRGRACALGAVAVAKSITKEIADAEDPDDAMEHGRIARYLGLDHGYVEGFVEGFDEGDDEKHLDWGALVRVRGEFNAYGYRDGVRAAAAVLKRVGR